MSVAQQFSNPVQHMSSSAHGHPSSYQGVAKSLVVENDVIKRIQASVIKNGIRIQEFFIDFDKLRKGTCGEAAVSYILSCLKLFNSSAPAWALFRFSCTRVKFLLFLVGISAKTAAGLLITLVS
jgi:hypothetical protein